jgi:hypothetical protein
MHGYIGHTDLGWWQFLRERPALGEVNFGDRAAGAPSAP